MPQQELFNPTGQIIIEAPLPPLTEEREVVAVHFDFMTISGDSGTGKTTIGHALETRYSAFNVHYIKGGEDFRSRRDQPVIGYADRPLKEDRDLDTRLRESIATSGQGAERRIIESRLAGWHATEVQKARERAQEMPLQGFRVYLTTKESEIRFKRVWERERIKPPHIDDPTFTVDFVAQQTLEREARDMDRFSEVNDFQGVNPLDPKSPLYDLVIYTDNMSQQEVEEAIHRVAVSRNLVEERVVTPLPSSGVIFDAQQSTP